MPVPPKAFYPSEVALDAARDAILGAWRLVAFEDREDESDAWQPTFGSRPRGMLIYDRVGVMSVHIFAADNDPTASMRNTAYFGTYILREAQRDGHGFTGVLEHHIEATSMPLTLVEGPDRPFRVANDILVLGDGLTWRRRFERVV